MTGVAGGGINPSIPSAGPKGFWTGGSFGDSAPREKRGAFFVPPMTNEQRGPTRAEDRRERLGRRLAPIDASRRLRRG